MSITLKSLKAEQCKLAAMIASFEQQAKAQEAIHFPEQLGELQQGEHYAGIIVGKDGEASYHLVLLPGNNTVTINWSEAKIWAKAAGGELPTQREQALLYANLKEQFEGAWYWSGEQHAAHSDYAWCQYFYHGYQDLSITDTKLRARAVRRIVIE